MSGDPAITNDDELVNQIDELKARMDRLMSVGTSTSNSALLTEAIRTNRQEAAVREPVATADPVPPKTRVRDLIDADDTEIVEVYPGPKKAVPFPEAGANVARDDHAPAAAPSRGEPSRPPLPPSLQKERSAPVGGSVIRVQEDHRETRPQVMSFDDMGRAIQQELDKDSSVPPVELKKGPDLASRFGPAAETPSVAAPPVPPVPKNAVVTVTEDPVDDLVDVVEDDDEIEDDAGLAVEQPIRSSAGLVTAIWVLTAIASGAIATLHYTGVI